MNRSTTSSRLFRNVLHGREPIPASSSCVLFYALPSSQGSLLWASSVGKSNMKQQNLHTELFPLEGPSAGKRKSCPNHPHQNANHFDRHLSECGPALLFRRRHMGRGLRRRDLSQGCIAEGEQDWDPEQWSVVLLRRIRTAFYDAPEHTLLLQTRVSNGLK